MKASMDQYGVDDATGEPRRGLFRRTRRTDGSHEAAASSTHRAVATVDDLARRMDQLTAAGPVADDPVRAEFELQRAVIARANDLAAAANVAHGSTPVPLPGATTRVPVPTATATPIAPEAPMPQTAPTSTPETSPEDAELEARMDAALAPAAPTPAAPLPAAVELAAPAVATTNAGYVPTAAEGDDALAVLGIDITRVVRTIQDEAASVRHRIELEVRDAHVQATDIIDRAEGEAERIREHGQSQARVLLGEVEEIISEAQQTGEQILHRANDEASNLRKDATAVLQSAQSEARAIVETARREGEQVLAEQRRLATVRAQEAMREQDRLKDQIRRLEERRRQVLESLEPLISQLTQMMPAGLEQNVVQLERQRAAMPQG